MEKTNIIIKRIYGFSKIRNFFTHMKIYFVRDCELNVHLLKEWTGENVSFFQIRTMY